MTQPNHLDKPQIHQILSLSLTHSPYDVKWLPCSSKIVTIGQTSRGTGLLQLLHLTENKLEVSSEIEIPVSLKCCTFGASPLHIRQLATGDFNGSLKVYDMNTMKSVYTTVAHTAIINCIDGCSGTGNNNGPPEIVTGSRDGAVKVWDVRQQGKAVASIVPAEGETNRDVWSVAFGNAHNDVERYRLFGVFSDTSCISAGYENGDIKIFDLRMMALIYETNIKNGVCCMEFDRRDIKMNKLVVGSLEGRVDVLDVRTKHPVHGYAMCGSKSVDNTTVWTVRHLPQNRDIFASSAGNGGINVYKYVYPSQRSTMDEKNEHLRGNEGSLLLLNDAIIAEQPISAWDWSPDKLGLFAYASFDQHIRVGVVTKLENL